MPYLPLSALRTFEAVARRGSFSVAAEELCVTQSAVSHQIKHLEDWLGAPLFDRTGRPRLWPHGEALARTLAAAFFEIDAGCRRARRGSGPRTLVIAAIPSVAVCWLIPRLSGFRALHPEIAVRVVYAMHGRDADFGDVDLAFVFSDGPPRRPDARATPFLPGLSAPVCNPGVGAEMGAKIDKGADAEAILGAGLLHDFDFDGWRAWFCRARGEPPPRIAGPIFEDFNLLRAAALAGQGVALCPLAIVRDDLEAGRLVQVSNVCVRGGFGYFLLERTPADPASGVFAEMFKAWLFDARDAAPG